MKIYAPKYYKSFSCIADRCRHNCCIGWEIDVDEESACRYEALTHDYGKEIRRSMEGGETPHFRLDEKERCPHLDGQGLCRIITQLGEGYLCEICREHPRFYHKTAKGMEVGVGMACEEACRLVLSCSDYVSMDVVGQTEERVEEWEGFDVLPWRNALYAILSDATLPYTERLMRMYTTFCVSPADYTDEQWHGVLSSLEYLEERSRERFLCFRSELQTPCGMETALERALAYWIYRHVSQAWDAESFRCALGFALFCERLLASLVRAEGAEQVEELARVLSAELEYSEENTDAIAATFAMEA